MENAITSNFGFFSLIRFALPTIGMMVIFSLYTIVDGMFIARYVGENALAATNIVYPLLNVVLGVAIMFATGGCALVAKTMGEGQAALARERFTFITLAAAALGSVVAGLFLLFLTPIIYFLGATPLLYEDCRVYAQIMTWAAPIVVLKILFDYFFVAAGRPKLALYSGILGGVSNIALDYLLLGVYGWGVAGAAWATAAAYAVPALFGLGWFWRRSGALYFVKPRPELQTLLKTCGNGYSEMVTQLSLAVTTYLFNLIMLQYLGENGVAAITIVLYAEFLLTAVYLGFSSGVAPVIGYNFGSRDAERLRRLMRYSYAFILISSVASLLTAEFLAAGLVAAFADRGTAVYDITLHGFRLFALGFLFSGVNIFASGMFTAFSNGRASAIISFLRSFVFILLFMALLPPVFGADGIWLVVPAADVAALLVTSYFLSLYRVFHGYI